jgi:plasmid stabilization system protein ParE
MAKKIAWTDQAQEDVRAIDRDTAIDLLQGLARFIATRFQDLGDSITVLRVRHRKDAYR